MPLTGTLPSFCFDINVTPLAAVTLDPTIATGYDYVVTTGSPFRSVLLPQIGNSNYELFLWNGSQYVFDQTLPAGVEHLFGLNGVDRFRITGIDLQAALAPNDPLAFPTTVSFLGGGDEEIAMTPLTSSVSASVPEPSTWLMMVTGLAGLVGYGWRRKRT
jgi:hypothetical protein